MDDNGKLTPDGVWASKLRLDHPLLIGEAIRKGGFNDASPAVMAGLTALFVWDREQEVETRLGGIDGLDTMLDAYERLIGSMDRIIGHMDKGALIIHRSCSGQGQPFSFGQRGHHGRHS